MTYIENFIWNLIRIRSEQTNFGKKGDPIHARIFLKSQEPGSQLLNLKNQALNIINKVKTVFHDKELNFTQSIKIEIGGYVKKKNPSVLAFLLSVMDTT